MSSDRQRRIEELFAEAADMAPGERAAFLDAQCGDDAALRADVEELLRHDTPDSNILDRAPVRLVEEGRRATDPETVGPYRIMQRLGEGGFGIVYVAEQSEPIRRRVALKLVKAGMDTNAVLARFEAERQALALMDHPNIARVLDAGATEGGRPYFVMELVRGDSLTDYCDRQRLGTRERLELFIPVCRAVQHAHQKGVIHRDLKPTNILVTIVDGQPVPKIIDFGIAKAIATPLTSRPFETVQGQMVGTPAYMSPEQAELTGLDVDTTTDVYSLGVVLYELLCGELPVDPMDFPDMDARGFHELLRNVDPPKPSDRLTQVSDRAVKVATDRNTDPWTLVSQIRGELDWIVQRATEKDRTRRYQTALALANDIRAHLDNEPVAASPPSAAYRMKKFARRYRVGLSIAGALFVGLLAAGAALTYALIESKKQQSQARAAQAESEAVTAFLSTMMRAVSPSEQGKDVTMKEVLDGAGAGLTRDFADQPLVEAELRSTLGVAYAELGEFDAAETHLVRAYDLRRDQLGDDDPETVTSLYDLGALWQRSGKYARADSTLSAAMEARHIRYGEESREYLEVAEELAGVYVLQERLEDVLELAGRTHEIALRALGEDDPLTHNIGNNLAIAYRETGDFDKAETIMRDNMEFDIARFGARSLEGATAQHNLAGLYTDLERYDEARPLYESSAEAAREILGEDHPLTLRFQSNLALLYSNLELYDLAEPLSRHVSEARDRLLGPDNPSSIVSQINLALLYKRMGRWDDCLVVIDQTRRNARALVGTDHLYSIAADGVRASALLGRGDAVQAERELADVVVRSRRTFPEGHWRIAHALTQHGIALRDLGRYDEAGALMLEAHASLESMFGSDSDRVYEVVDELVELYRQWGRDAERAQWETRRRPTS